MTLPNIRRQKYFLKLASKQKCLPVFSLVAGEKGSADTERDPRGFALKFYTEDGNWDLVGNNTPVFLLKTRKSFLTSFTHKNVTQKQIVKALL